jgi:hypothetical protein
MSTVWAFVIGIVPSIGIGGLFWWIMRKVVHADRNERAALAKLDAEPSRDTEHETQPRQ